MRPLPRLANPASSFPVETKNRGEGFNVCQENWSMVIEEIALTLKVLHSYSSTLLDELPETAFFITFPVYFRGGHCSTLVGGGGQHLEDAPAGGGGGAQGSFFSAQPSGGQLNVGVGGTSHLGGGHGGWLSGGAGQESGFPTEHPPGRSAHLVTIAGSLP